MAFTFNADEIFEIAQQIERNGAAFYRQAARQFPAHAALLLQLAEQEDQHEHRFAAMRRELTVPSTTETADDLDRQAAAFLQALAGGYVVDLRRKPHDLFTSHDTLNDILRVAIGLEKDSIIFYLGLKNMMSTTADRDAVDAIIKEEQEHIGVLFSLAKEHGSLRE